MEPTTNRTKQIFSQVPFNEWDCPKYNKVLMIMQALMHETLTSELPYKQHINYKVAMYIGKLIEN